MDIIPFNSSASKTNRLEEEFENDFSRKGQRHRIAHLDQKFVRSTSGVGASLSKYPQGVNSPGELLARAAEKRELQKALDEANEEDVIQTGLAKLLAKYPAKPVAEQRKAA